MPAIRRIWKDISSGKNIDLYSTVVAAITVSVLGLVNTPLKSGAQDLTAQITLAVLALLAIGTLSNRHRLEGVLSDRNPLTGMTGYYDWTEDEVYAAITSAKSSIVIVESWFGGVQELANHIRKAAEQAKTNLQVEVCVLAPNSLFGAQRLAEVDDIFDETSEQLQIRFQDVFEHSLDQLRRWRLGEHQIDLKVYTYDTLPEIRMYVIDDQEFFFGWFPLGRPSTQVACLRISMSEASGVGAKIIEDLRNQLQEIKKRAKPHDLTEGNYLSKGSPYIRRRANALAFLLDRANRVGGTTHWGQCGLRVSLRDLLPEITDPSASSPVRAPQVRAGQVLPPADRAEFEAIAGMCGIGLGTACYCQA